MSAELERLRSLPKRPRRAKRCLCGADAEVQTSLMIRERGGAPTTILVSKSRLMCAGCALTRAEAFFGESL